MAVVRKMVTANSQPVKDLVARFGVGKVALMMGLSQATISDAINSDQCRATFAYLAKHLLDAENRGKPAPRKLTMLVAIDTQDQKNVFMALAKSMNLKCVLWDLNDLAGGNHG